MVLIENNSIKRIRSTLNSNWNITKVAMFYLSISFLTQTFLAFVLEIIPFLTQFADESVSIILNILHNIIMIIIIISMNRGSLSLEIKIHKGRFNNFDFLKLVFFSIFIYQVINIFLSLFEWVLEKLDPNYFIESPYGVFLDDFSTLVLFALLVLSFGPIYEEILFRFILFTNKKEGKVINVAIFTALIFSFIHIPANLTMGSIYYTIFHFIVALILGLTLAYLYYNYGLKVSILFHILWNGLNLISQVLLIFNNEFILYFDFIIAFISILFSIGMLKLIKNFRSSVYFSKCYFIDLFGIVPTSIIILLFILLPFPLFYLSEGFALIYLFFLLILYCFVVIKFEKDVSFL